MAKFVLFIPQDKLNEISTQWMISQSKLEHNKGLLPLMDIQLPLVCKGQLMSMKFQGIPTDKDLQTYPSVHLTSPQEWDPSVLDYVHPNDNGEPNLTYDSTEKFQVDSTFDEF